MKVQPETKQTRKGKNSVKDATRQLAPEQFVDIIEHINDGVVVLDKDWYYVYVNQKAAVMLQREKPSDLIGKHIWAEYPEGVGQPFHRAYEKAMQEQTPVIFEDHYEPWDLWFENRIYPSPDGLLILFTEITDRKRIEGILRERQHFLQTILDMEPGIVYIYDIVERRNLYINRFWPLTFGYSREETQELGEELLGRIIHPDDLQRIVEHHENWRQADEHETRSIEYQIRTKQGEWRWLHSREVPFQRDAEGKVSQILGITHDITEQKHAETALRESEEIFSKVFYASPIPLNINRMLDGRYVDVNESFLERVGYRREEVIGKTALEIGITVHPEDFKKMLQSLSGGGSLRNFEAQFRTRSGEMRTALLFREIVELAGEKYYIGTNLDITERKRTEDALAASEAELRALFAAVNDVVLVIDCDGVYRKIAPTNPSLLYKPPEQLLGKTLHDIFPVEQAEAFIKSIRQVVETRQTAHIEYKLTIRGNEVWFNTAISAMGTDTTLWVARDITERKRMEEVLRESEKRYQLISTVASDYMFSSRLDADGRLNLDWVTAAFESITGYTMEEYIAHGGWRSTLHPDDLAIDDLDMQKLRANEPVITEVRTFTKKGEIVWVRVYAQPVLDGESRELVSIYGAVQDITVRKQAEERLQQLNEELEERIAARTEELAAAMIKAQESDRLKSAFLATMSHELRTPLNSIIGFTGVILQGLAGPLNEEQTKQLGMTRASAHHLLALINDVLDISKIEAGQLEIVRRPFDMRQAIEDVLRVVQPLLQKKDLQLRTSIGYRVGIINQDRQRVEQVLINLVNNAIKFTERGEVHIDCQVTDGWLEIRVRDTGIGIKSDDIQKLFKPFQQIDTGLTRSHEGTGLGLSICKRLVTAMGGKINVESQWGMGSTFKFTLPT